MPIVANITGKGAAVIMHDLSTIPKKELINQFLAANKEYLDAQEEVYLFTHRPKHYIVAKRNLDLILVELDRRRRTKV
jgi:hypothetical protein